MKFRFISVSRFLLRRFVEGMRNVHGEKCVIKKKDEDICSGLLVSEITPSEIEIAVEELERCKSPGVDQNSAH